MSHYRYSPLSTEADSIRLLRLMPHTDETAPIQCELFEYSLQETSRGSHLYEALSYVWGSPETPKSISVDKHNLHVTANLYAALLRLRDRCFERIVWTDFVCINQKDDKEKERQIQLMAKIYGLSDRVVVYLGEAADGSDEALEHLRVAAENESVTPSKSEKSQAAILELLEQPWFQRIWVLQEVAAARRILIMYGSAEMNGYAFCSGFNKLELSFAHPELQSLIRSVSYLIRGAIFRPKYAKSPSSGLSLGELIDMYHTRMSTEPNDKVYALLGMSSDDPNAAGLSPDYTVPWRTLFQRLIEFILFKEVFVETWDKSQRAIIKSKGCILGRVSLSEDDSARYDRQYVSVNFSNTPKSLEYESVYGTRWTLQASAKSIRKGDLICLLQGASKPIIIRAYKDYFAIIVIAATPRRSLRTESGNDKRQEPLDLAKSLSRDFLLLWNWETSQKILQNQERQGTSREINDLMPDYPKSASDKAVRSCDVALALGDWGKDKEAERGLQEAIVGCERVLGKEDLHTLAGKDGLALIYKSQNLMKMATNLFSQVIQTRKRVQGIDHQDTLSSIANLVLIYTYRLRLNAWEQERIKSLTDRIRDNIQITEEDMVHVTTSFGKGLMTLLLDLNRANVPITKMVVKAAAANKKSGKVVMGLLLDRRGGEVKITEEVLKAAAGNEKDGEVVMELLLDRRGGEVNITEEVLRAAAGNAQHGKGVMRLLLTRRRDEFKITEEVLKEVVSNELTGNTVLDLLHSYVSIKATVRVIEAAATSGQEQVLRQLDRWDMIGSDKERWFNISRLYNAAKIGRTDIIRQLIADGIPIDERNIRGETPLWIASAYGNPDVVEVLLATRAVNVNVQSISERSPLFWAAAHGHSRVVQLLLDHDVNTTCTDENGESPLSIAQFYHQNTVVAMLTAHESAAQDGQAKISGFQFIQPRKVFIPPRMSGRPRYGDTYTT